MKNKNYKSLFASTKLLIYLLIVSKSFYGYSAPLITSVTQNKSTVAKYEKYELTIVLSQTFSNNYDPAIIDLYAEFTSPQGTVKKVIGYYNEEYTRSTPDINNKPYPIEVNSPTGTKNWKIRFAADETGTWKYKVYAKTSSVTEVFPASGFNSFFCSGVLGKGFIQKRDNRYLKYSNGELFYPIGANYTAYPSVGWVSSEVYGTYYYESLFNTLNSNKINYFRLFADFMGAISLYGKDYTDDKMYYDNTFNQKDASQMDYLINSAALKNIAVQVCLFDYENLSDDSFAWGLWSGHGCSDNNGNNQIDANAVCDDVEGVDKCCDFPGKFNPFNIINNSDPNYKGELSHPKEFFDFSKTNSIRIQKNLIRYFIARWGYATNIVSWELFNETEQFANFTFNHLLYPYPTVADDNTLKNISTWHKNMKDYIKNIDPFNHLVTTSYAGTPAYFDEVMKYMDYTQIHRYTTLTTDPYKTSDYQKDFFDKSNTTYNYNVPFFVGETGESAQLKTYKVGEMYYYMDPNGFELHNNIWATTFSGHMGVPSMWFTGYIEEQNLFTQYKTLSTFVNRLGVLSNSFTPKYNEINGLRTYYLKSTDNIYGWVQDLKFRTNNLITDYVNPLNNKYLYFLSASDKPSPSSTNNTITINNTKYGFYSIKWYSTEGNNDLISTESIFSNGSLIITMPSSLRISSKQADAAFIATFDCSKTFWNWSGLNSAAGHNVAGDLAVNSNGQVFYRTTNNSINCIYYTGSAWTWSGLNGASGYNVAGDIVINSSDQIFYRTTDNSINCIYYSGGSWVWSGLNGAAGHNVAGDLVVNSNGQIFYRTTDNSINCIYYTGTGWTWSGLNSAAGHNVSGSLAINSGGAVFYKTTANSINCIYYTGSGWTWSGLNGAAGYNVASDLAIDSGDKVFYKTTSNSINCIYWGGSSWTWSGLNNAANGIATGSLVVGGDKIFFASSTSIKSIYWNTTWKLDHLNYASGNNVGGDLAYKNNKVFYRTNGTDKSINAIYLDNGCSSQLKSSFTIDENSSVETILNSVNENQPIIFPNPADNTLSIKNAIGIIQITNTIGVKYYEFRNSEMTISINTSNWPKGVYIVSVQNNTSKYSCTAIIQH